MAGFGTPPTSPLPIVGVTTGPQWASMLNVAVAELQTIVTPKIGPSQIDIGTASELNHGPRTIVLGVLRAIVTNGAAARGGAFGAEYINSASGTDEVCWDIELALNDRLTQISVFADVAVATAFQVGVYLVVPSAPTVTLISDIASSTSTAGTKKLLVTGLSSTSIGVNSLIRVRWLANAINNKVRAVEYVYDKIA